MKYINAAFGWMWRNKLFLGIIFASAAFFSLMRFPFNDLSDAVTSAIAQGTRNQVYLQAREMNFHIFPQPALSAEDLTVDTALPPIEAKWAKITPGLFSVLFNLPTIISAANGNPQAAQSLGTRLGINVDAEGVFGGDIDLSLSGGKKSENGLDRTRISLTVSEINLKDVGQWADLPLKMQGRGDLAAEVEIVPSFQDQPEGEFDLRVNKFVMPAGIVNIPMGEASMPLNLPAITLQNALFKGRLVNGQLVIEEGTFGKSQDPLYGRIKGQLAMRLVPTGQGVAPQFGQYNLTVDLTTNGAIQKDIGFAFLPLESAKQPTSGGGAKYLFKASGQGVGMAYVPTITQVSSF